MDELRKRMAGAIERIPLVDTHEHIMQEAERNDYAVDFSYLFAHYNSSDVVSAGMPPPLMEAARLPINRYRVLVNERTRAGRFIPGPLREDMSLEERWQAIEPYWAAIRNTAYAHWTLIAARDLFGVEDLNRDTYMQLSEAIAASRKPGWYRRVLREKAGIARSVIDLRTTEVDKELFAPVVRMDPFIVCRTRVDLRFLEEESGTAIHKLGDLQRAMERVLSDYVEAGAVGVKNGLAYQRTLKYEKVTRHEAEVVFDRIFGHLGEGPSWKEAKPLQDYMFHRVIQVATDQNLPIQIHTGLQEGNENIITNSRPTHLINLLIEYREARFDLFHGGYPYHHEWVTLAKNFANVYPDMCWVYIISPTLGRQLLHELIETVPGNKILAFGGDSMHVEGAYAHSRMAREAVARVLTEKVEEGYLTETQAVELAKRMLNDNPAELYGFKD
jgi:predicted TIM-barrel fold metal-dependent hydrolase